MKFGGESGCDFRRLCCWEPSLWSKTASSLQTCVSKAELTRVRVRINKLFDSALADLSLKMQKVLKIS